MSNNKLNIDSTWSPESKPQKNPSPWDVETSAINVKHEKPKKEWMNRPILSPKHHNDLELKSAIGQFVLKQPKEQAEALAYKDYMNEHSRSAASHHLGGIQSALEAGDKSSAQKHGVMYNLHMRSLGLDPIAPPPKDIMAGSQKSKNYKFSAHPADMFLTHNMPVKKSEDLNKGNGSTNQIGASAPSNLSWMKNTALFKSPKPKVMPIPKQAKMKPNKLMEELEPSPFKGSTPFAPPNAIGDKDIGLGKEHVNRLKLQTNQPKSDLSWRSRTPLKNLNPAKIKSKKDKNQIINEAISILENPKG